MTCISYERAYPETQHDIGMEQIDNAQNNLQVNHAVFTVLEVPLLLICHCFTHQKYNEKYRWHIVDIVQRRASSSQDSIARQREQEKQHILWFIHQKRSYMDVAVNLITHQAWINTIRKINRTINWTYNPYLVKRYKRNIEELEEYRMHRLFNKRRTKKKQPTVRSTHLPQPHESERHKKKTVYDEDKPFAVPASGSLLPTNYIRLFLRSCMSSEQPKLSLAEWPALGVDPIGNYRIMIDETRGHYCIESRENDISSIDTIVQEEKKQRTAGEKSFTWTIAPVATSHWKG